MSENKLSKAKSLKELKEIYSEEIKRKDEIIKKLREDNEILLKTALKSTKDKIELKNTD